MRPLRHEQLLELEDDAEQLLYEWTFAAREKQLPPEWAWRIWLVLAGRGFGKTRTGAEWIRQRVESKEARYIVLAGPTAPDIRDAMIEGESGLLSVFPRLERPQYEPSKRRVTFHTGARALLISADEPDRFRNKQHDTVWADELAAWKYRDAWDQCMFGLRLGENPQALATTTPRPIPLIKELVKDAQGLEPTVALTRGTTKENEENLADPFLKSVVKKYEGTRLGRQELGAEILGDTPGALWTLDLIDARRIPRAPDLDRIVVAVDPSVADRGRDEIERERNNRADGEGEGKGDECGIVVAGTALCGCKGVVEKHAFVLDDATDHMTPNEWAQRVAARYRKFDADRVIGEENNGGALVEVNVRTADKLISYRGVHASKGKRTRAEPVASLYEQGKVHHVGSLAKLEDELTTWDASTGARSPNRLDALVWGLTELMLGSSVAGYGDEKRRPMGSRRM